MRAREDAADRRRENWAHSSQMTVGTKERCILAFLPPCSQFHAGMTLNVMIRLNTACTRNKNLN